MSLQTTLIEFIKQLLGTGSESIQLRDYFAKDPQGALNEYGLGHLTPEDVHDAMVLVQDNDTVSFDRHYDTGAHFGSTSNWLGTAAAPPASEWHQPGRDGGHDGHRGWDGGGKHHDPAEHVREHVTNNYVTNNYDDRDTIVDNSVNQNIDTHGGNVHQSFDNNSVTASGDGAVAAGHDISGSTVSTGNGNVVGQGNQVVHGDDDTTAFGSGSASNVGHVSADNGAGVSVGGDASGHSSTTDSFDRSTTETDTSTHVEDSFNQDHYSSTQLHEDDHSSTKVLSDNHVGVGGHDVPVH